MTNSKICFYEISFFFLIFVVFSHFSLFVLLLYIYIYLSRFYLVPCLVLFNVFIKNFKHQYFTLILRPKHLFARVSLPVALLNIM